MKTLGLASALMLFSMGAVYAQGGAPARASLASPPDSCPPGPTLKACEQARVDALFKQLDAAQADFQAKAQAARYLDAVKQAVRSQFLGPAYMPQTPCLVKVVQKPGGWVKATLEVRRFSCPGFRRIACRQASPGFTGSKTLPHHDSARSRRWSQFRRTFHGCRLGLRIFLQ